jgi:predicted dehydrogenase
MSKTIRVGIVGTGSMAADHAKRFASISGVKVTACYDILPSRGTEFARTHGIAHAVGDIDALLQEVDAVSIVTPDAVHAVDSLKVLKAHKHLLCEKPLTTTLADARAVAAEARKASRHGVIHMVNFSYRRSAALQKAMDLVAKGAIGDLRHVHSSYLQSWIAQPIWGHWTQEQWLWRMQSVRGSAGVLGDVGCHILDLTTAVSGPVQAVRCSLATMPKIAPNGKPVTRWGDALLDANDSALIELRFANGALGIIHTSRWATGHANHLRCEVHGTKGALQFDLDASYEVLNTCLGRQAAKAAWSAKALKPAPTIWHRFARAIRKGQPDQPDVFRGAEIQAYLDACLTSARTEVWTRVPDWAEV